MGKGDQATAERVAGAGYMGLIEANILGESIPDL